MHSKSARISLRSILDLYFQVGDIRVVPTTPFLDAVGLQCTNLESTIMNHNHERNKPIRHGGAHAHEVGSNRTI